VQLDGRKLASSARSLEFRVSLPKGTKLNPGAQSTLKVVSDNPEVLRFPAPKTPFTKETALIDLSAKTGHTKVRLHLTLYYCDTTNAGLCYFDEVRLVVPLEVSGQAEDKLAVSYELGQNHWKTP